MSDFDEEVVVVSKRRKKRNKPMSSIAPASRRPLERKFDNAKEAMVTPPKRVQLAKPQRRQGRPSGGHVTVSQKRIDALDDVTYEAKVARTLGIGRGTLAQWIDPEQTRYPLPFVLEDGHRLFRRDIVLKWLQDTSRWIQREEYRR